MSSVAVIAHARKTVGGGLAELREELGDAGVAAPLWYEVEKSRKAPKQLRHAIASGADLVFVWGGDGTVQRCIDAMPAVGGRADNVPLAIVPAGTANLLATNLGVPVGDIRAAVHVGLHGTRRAIDVGVLNGERFAVMAGAGFDAQMLRDADGGLKRRFGRLAYVWTGVRNTGAPRVGTRVSLDGKKWFDGKAACVLVGNVGTLIGGVRAFPDARPDDGELEVGVVTAAGPWQWGRALGRVVAGRAGDSPFVETARATKIDVRLDRPVPFELDGGVRGASRRLRVGVQPAAVTVCVPERIAAP
jgi:diacylglycerol kinase (ATP)